MPDEINKIKPAGLPPGDEKFLHSDAERAEMIEEQTEAIEEDTNVEESLRIAIEKLHTLLGDNFTDFGIRFVNVEEYLWILTNQKLPHREVGKFSPQLKSELGKETINFTQYLQESVAKGWEDIIYDQTDWSHSLYALQRYSMAMTKLREFHREVKHQPNRENTIREATTNRFKEYLTSTILGDEQSVGLRLGIEQLKRQVDEIRNEMGDDDSEARVSEIFSKVMLELNSGKPPRDLNILFPEYFDESGQEDVFADLKTKGQSTSRYMAYGLMKIAENYGIQTLDLMEFLTQIHPNSQVLRKAIYTYCNFNPSHGFRVDSKDQYRGASKAPYQMAMVYSKEVTNTPGFKDWYALDDNQIKNSGTSLGSHLLGVVACFPMQEFTKKLVEISSESGKWACPVFDAHGIAQYPIEKPDDVALTSNQDNIL